MCPGCFSHFHFRSTGIGDVPGMDGMVHVWVYEIGISVNYMLWNWAQYIIFEFLNVVHNRLLFN